MKRIIHYRWWIIAVVLAGTLAISGNLFNISVDADLKNFFPQHMESVVNTELIEDVFGNQDMVMIIFAEDDIINEPSLTRVKNIDRYLNRIEGVKKTTSLFGSNRIYGEDGIMFVEPTIRRIPRTAEEAAGLKEIILENDMVNGVVAAEDFSSTAILVTLDKNVNEDSLFTSIHRLLDEFPGNEEVHFGGIPYIRQAINKDIARDGLILIPAALLLMIIFLFLVFREIRGVLLPFLVVILSSVTALALLPMLGWKFYVITVLVPIMLIAIANDYGIHIIAKYQEINAMGFNAGMKEIARLIARKLWKPILITGLTTIAGISAMMAHSMIPARQMAVISAIGIAAAIFYSILLLPAILSLMKRSRPVRSLAGRQARSKINPLGRLSGFITTRYRVIPLAALGITILLGSGILFLRVDSNEENFFPENHAVRQAARLINRDYGGSETLSVMFSGDMLDPGLLRRIDGYKQELLKNENIDLVMTFPDVILEISKALNDPGTPMYDTIPGNRNAVAQYMELYTMNGDPENISQLVDFNYTRSHMMIRINDASNTSINAIINDLELMTEGDEALAAIGGYGFVRAQLANKVVTGQFWSLAIALLIIFILLALIFRSLLAGLISTIPLLMSVIMLFGIMGITGVRLDIATALLSSVMIGVGVDYTIHFLWRYRDERQKGKSARESVFITLTTTGRGIVFNALSVIVGFVVLIFSAFTPIRFFGILIVVSIFACLSGSLIVLPALILKYRFRFLEPGYTKFLKSEDDGLKEAV